MRFSTAIDHYVADMRSQGRLNSTSSERGYRQVLDAHAADVTNRDPRTIGREQVKTTLRRWANPNTQRKARSVLVSFYDWAMEEGIRKDNPARQTRRPKKRPTTVYRLTRAEAAAMLAAATTPRERRAIHLGICAGLRNAELRGLRGRHFHRDGFVHVSADIAKGGRERWVPVIADLQPVVDEIRQHVAPDEYVLPAVRWRDPGKNTVRINLKYRPFSSQALRTLVMDVAKRSRISAHIHPHLMRHAFGDHVARYAGMRNAQALLGHATVGTTETYVGQPTLDELAGAVRGFGYAAERPTAGDSERTQTHEELRTNVPPFIDQDETIGRGADRNRTGALVESGPLGHFFAEGVEGLLEDWPAVRRNIDLYTEAFA